MPEGTDKQDRPKEGIDAKARGDVDTSQDLGQKAVQKTVDKIEEKGYIGTTADPTPRENYGASNSTKENDLPTPETDREAYLAAREHTHGVFPKDSVDRTTVETANTTTKSAPKHKGGDK